MASRVNTPSECANNDSACEREIMTNDINENISDIYADDCFPDFFFSYPHSSSVYKANILVKLM